MSIMPQRRGTIPQHLHRLVSRSMLPPCRHRKKSNVKNPQHSHPLSPRMFLPALPTLPCQQGTVTPKLISLMSSRSVPTTATKTFQCLLTRGGPTPSSLQQPFGAAFNRTCGPFQKTSSHRPWMPFPKLYTLASSIKSLLLVPFFQLRFNGSLDVDIHGVAEDLMTSYAFLQEDPDFPQEEGMFRSTFLLELIGSTHLSNITGFVEVPGWDVQGMARGENGEGILAMASAALERAVKFITKGTIDVEQVLADMANGPDSKMKIKLPKVLNKLTGHESSAPFQFLATNWNGDTAAYREAIQKRGQAFACSVFAAAQAHKGTKSGTGSDADASESGIVNPRALL
ncbi:hypothetical protein BS17DRAFT_454989 [Gyrodon lividus]|nr:hypothetical protein BS17DRAFT_454989 [Gyrodon lividus]